MESQQGRLGVLFVPQPNTVDEEGIMYCNIKGDNNSATNISIGVKPGGQQNISNNLEIRFTTYDGRYSMQVQPLSDSDINSGNYAF